MMGRKRRKWRSGVFVVEGDINDLPLLKKLFELVPFTHVMHLAAQAGVRYAMDNPSSYGVQSGKHLPGAIPVSDLATILERLLKVKAKRNMMKLPRNGDVQFTHANISWAQRELPLRICILVSRSLLDGILVTTTGAKRKLPLDLLGLSLHIFPLIVTRAFLC
ncbi:hypothetical protein Bca52824_095036 [Brassica carinata]|uniref:NAD(P)-binding domain-containing protein n=1 Tax=Brassica carinata TaxID=52824 RepID=A0A8X7TIL6_BRACI|nr:hypothetical protein Bca52824_095036 [Brassica carinata]